MKMEEVSVWCAYQPFLLARQMLLHGKCCPPPQRNVSLVCICSLSFLLLVNVPLPPTVKIKKKKRNIKLFMMKNIY